MNRRQYFGEALECWKSTYIAQICDERQICVNLSRVKDNRCDRSIISAGRRSTKNQGRCGVTLFFLFIGRTDLGLQHVPHSLWDGFEHIELAGPLEPFTAIHGYHFAVDIG